MNEQVNEVIANSLNNWVGSFTKFIDSLAIPTIEELEESQEEIDKKLDNLIESEKKLEMILKKMIEE